MALIEVNWHPNRKDLHSFGSIALITTFLIALLLYILKGVGLQWTLPIFLVGLLIFLCSLISLRLTRIIYLGLTLVTVPIGVGISFLVMAAFYFLLLMPIGMFFRLIGRDALRRKFEPDAKTYWLARQTYKEPERYFRQF
ncbi:MAG: hypothetical protein ACYSTG_01045 [Planctomycetota bacterium]|jgi:hypothetical protein